MRRLLLAFTYGLLSLLFAIVLGSVLLAPYMTLVFDENFSLEIIPIGILMSGWFSAPLLVPGIVLFYLLPAFKLKPIQLMLILVVYTGLAMLLELKFIAPVIYGAGRGDINLISACSLPHFLAYFGALVFFATRPRMRAHAKASP